MITFASHDTIGTHKSSCRLAISGPVDQEGPIVSAEPIQTRPPMKKVVVASPAVCSAKFFDIFATLTDNNVTGWLTSDVIVATNNISKQSFV